MPALVAGMTETATPHPLHATVSAVMAGLRPGHPRRDAARFSESGLAGKPWRPRADAKSASPVFSKTGSHGILKNQPSVGGGFERAKSLERIESALADLQAFGITQNRKENLWKSLEKKALDLEKLGKKAGRLGGGAAVIARNEAIQEPRRTGPIRLPGSAGPGPSRRLAPFALSGLQANRTSIRHGCGR